MKINFFNLTEKIINKVFWENLSTYDFSNLDLQNHLAILPIAAIEQHGPHLPVSVDSKIIDGLINKIAKKLTKGNKLLFLPTQKIGKSNEHSLFPGTLSLSVETLISTLIDIGKCVDSAGIKKLVFLNSHGGNISTMDIVARELRVQKEMLVFNINWFGFGMPDGVFSEHELKYGIHAGDLETSIMLALDPDNVEMKRAENFASEMINIEKKFKNIGLNSAAKVAWQSQDLNKKGACGNAKISTAIKGEITLDFVSKKLLKIFKEIEDMPLTFISTKTDY